MNDEERKLYGALLEIAKYVLDSKDSRDVVNVNPILRILKNAGMLQTKKKSDDTELIEKSEHSFTTETPRPNAAAETVEKSYQKDFSPILKDAREAGFEGLSSVAQNILSGKYYKPSDDEVRGF